MSKLADRATAKDPAIALQAVAAMRRLLDRIEELHVDRSRELGYLWQDIASWMGVTKQAVHSKHAARRKAQGKEA